MSKLRDRDIESIATFVNSAAHKVACEEGCGDPSYPERYTSALDAALTSLVGASAKVVAAYRAPRSLTREEAARVRAAIERRSAMGEAARS